MILLIILSPEIVAHAGQARTQLEAKLQPEINSLSYSQLKEVSLKLKLEASSLEPQHLTEGSVGHQTFAERHQHHQGFY